MKAGNRFLLPIAKMTISFAAFSSSVMACPLCRAEVRSNIYDNHFTGNFLAMVLPLCVVALIGAGLFHADKFETKWQKFYGKK